MTQLHPENSPNADRGSSVNQISINLGGATLIVVVLMTVIIGACGIVMGIDIAERSVQARNYDLLERQYRMVELKLDDWTVVAHRSGLVLPGDYTRGPQGNLDTESFKNDAKGGGFGSEPNKKPTRSSQGSNGR